MKALMRNSLVLQFKWVGSRGKQSFYNLQLSPVIFGELWHFTFNCKSITGSHKSNWLVLMMWKIDGTVLVQLGLF